MSNNNLFRSLTGLLTPRADTVNEAGGVAYKLSPEQALAQYAATGCFNHTFYASAGEQLEAVLGDLTGGYEADLDFSQFLRAFREMIQNAARFPRTGDPVHVRIAASGLEKQGRPWIRIVVTDDGRGVAREHWTRIRTNNPLERLNLEIKRRTRVVGTFPDGESALSISPSQVHSAVAKLIKG